MYANKEYLNEKIEAIYDMFAHYCPEPNITLCSCCSTKDDQINLNRILLSSIKHLNEDDLWEYESAWAINSGLSPETTKHFIPWYMERVLSLKNWILPSSALDFLSKIDNSDFKDEEIKLLESSLLALCDYCLNLDPREDIETYFLMDIDEFILMCGYFDLQKVLDLWLTHSHYTAILHFKNLIYNGFNKQNKLLTKWVSSSKTSKAFADKIENLILFESEEVSEKNLEELSLFYEVLVIKDI